MTPASTSRPHWGALALGGAVGTLLRAGGVVLFPPAPGGIPWVTLVENVGGAFLLGWLAGVLVRRFPSSPALRDFLLPGVLGSFTTFSALAVDSVLLGPAAGGTYLVLSVVLGLIGAGVGLALGRRGREG
jgi:CrcB protein